MPGARFFVLVAVGAGGVSLAGKPWASAGGAMEVGGKDFAFTLSAGYERNAGQDLATGGLGLRIGNFWLLGD